MTSKRRLALLTMATGLSTLGSQATAIALPWIILQGDNAAGLIGVAAALNIGTTVLLGIPAGTVVARLGPWRALLLHEAAGLASVVLFAATLIAGAPLVPSVLGISLLLGAIRPILITGVTLAAADIDHRPAGLTSINGIIASAQQVGLIGGQALGGFAVATWGATWAIALDAATFVGGGALFAFVALGSPIVGPREAKAPGRSWQAIRSLLADAVLRRYIVIAASLGATMQLFLVYLPAVIAQLQLDAQWYGWSVAAIGCGAAISGILVGPLTRRLSLPLVLVVGIVFCVVPLTVPVLAGFTASTLILAMVLVGLGSAFVNAPLRTVLLTRISPMHRPRATAAALTTVTAATPLGAMLAAAALTALPPTTAWTMSIFAATVVASTATAQLVLQHRADTSRAATARQASKLP